MTQKSQKKSNAESIVAHVLQKHSNNQVRLHTTHLDRRKITNIAENHSDEEHFIVSNSSQTKDKTVDQPQLLEKITPYMSAKFKQIIADTIAEAPHQSNEILELSKRVKEQNE